MAPVKTAHAPLGRGLIVLGMHRSGTSAVTGAIDALGLPACRVEDRMPAQQSNERGFFESRSLAAFDERLLNRLGGTWFVPPTLRAGWQARRGLLDSKAQAANLFRDAHPFQSWVWKDPRACVLMPFWDLVLGPDMPRLVVLRNPLESAASLQSRNQLPLELGLALSERHLRSSFRDSAERPVLVTAFDELFDDLPRWSKRVFEFARSNGVAMPASLGIDNAQAFLSDELRHFRETTRSADFGVFDGLQRLWTWAYDRIGAHNALSIKGLPRESHETEAVFRAVRARVDHLADP
jgi:hypothetical protein